MVITRAPDVHLRRWLMHSAYFFKTKSSSMLLMLKSKQINVFCYVKNVQQIQKTSIFPNRGRPQGNINKKENRDFSKSKLGPFKIDLQIEFGNIFYTILNYFDPCVSLDPSKLSGKPEIWLK